MRNDAARRTGWFRTMVATALALVIAVLSGCSLGGAPAPAQEVKSRAASYTNPVFEPKSSIPAEASDPMTLKYNGEYYTYVTGGVCGVLHSTDLVTWEFLGPVVSDTASCWAPDVVYKNGTFYMYASSTKWGEDERARRVRLYTAPRPEGPFTYVADVTDHYSYDGHYFQAADDQEYLYWTRECGFGMFPCSGNPTLVDNLTDMVKLSGKPARVGTPIEWECAGRCIFEAPQVTERDGQFYLLYSGGAYENETYGSGYARSAVAKGPDRLEDMSYARMNQVLKSAPGEVSGPGGSSWVKGPTNLEDWIVYHGRNKDAKGGLGRWLRIDPVMWGTDRFWMPGAPSYTAQPGPALPSFRDLFDRTVESGLGEGWKVNGGAWSVKEGAAQASGDGEALAGDPAFHYTVEANLRFGAGATGAAGLYAYYLDTNNWVEALVHPADATLVVRAKVDGKEQPEVTQKLPAGTRPETFHQLLVRKNGSRFDFAVDGLPVVSAAFGYAHRGQAGLVVHNAAVSFDGFAFAHGWEDFFATGTDMAGWGDAQDGTKASGQWAVKEGALQQQNAKGRSVLFKGSRDWGSYHLTATLQPLDPAAPKGRYGLYATYWDARNYVAVLLDPAGKQLILRAVLNGKAQKEEKVALPQEMVFTDPHTLRVTKNGFAFRVDLDGVLVAERQWALAQGQPGLITEESAASFDSIQAVRWD